MKTFKYIGPSDAVDLVGVGTVIQGATVEVEDPAASASLENQGDVWEHIPGAKRSAAKRAADSTDLKEA